MGCDKPLTAYYGREVNPKTGKRGITFQRNASHSGIPMELACGRCMGCRLERSRQWAIRCMHEKMMHVDNVFLTITYDDVHLPEFGTLVREHPQLFLKRLRDRFGSGIRFYGCGEYGKRTARPHYHFILFNFDAPDKKFYKLAKRGEKLYSSQAISELWTYGFNVLGDVTFDSCAYVARYVTDKINGDASHLHYQRVTSDGQVVQLLPEFSMMSRMPGIGSGWFEKYGDHAYQFDSVISNGREVRPPRFYDTRYEVLDSEHLAKLKLERRRKAISNPDNTRHRRYTKEDALRIAMKAKTQEF